MKKILLFLFIFTYCIGFNYSMVIKKIRSFYLEQNQKVFIQEPISYFITKDNYIFLLDRKACNLKIFNNNGKLIKTLGKKGLGPYEFVNPVFCSNYKNKVLIYDFKRKKLYFYNKSEKNNLIEYKNLQFGDLSFSFKFINDNKLLIAGNTTIKNFSLYIYDINKKRYEYLLPSHLCYDLKSENELHMKFMKEFVYLPSNGFCAFSNNYFFYVLATKIRIVRFNRKTKKTFVFGKKTDKFSDPYINKELRKAYKQRKTMLMNELEKKMSLVLGLFCFNKDRIGLVYTKYNKQTNFQSLYLQVYNSKTGEYIKEIPFLKTKTSYQNEIKFYYNKINKFFYIIAAEGRRTKDIEFKVYQFKIER